MSKQKKYILNIYNRKTIILQVNNLIEILYFKELLKVMCNINRNNCINRPRVRTICLFQVTDNIIHRFNPASTTKLKRSPQIKQNNIKYSNKQNY